MMMIEWYYVVIIALYIAGAVGLFVLHAAFDGAFGRNREGPLMALIFSLLWPLWCAAMFLILPVQFIWGKLKP